jgi:hypothetical protein
MSFGNYTTRTHHISCTLISLSYSLPATGPRFLGLFASPLEAAFVREQILDREGFLAKKSKKAGEDKSYNKHLENFTKRQWAMFLEINVLMENFIKK